MSFGYNRPEPTTAEETPMSIYTRAGDTGTTRLADGTRASKADPRIEALGTLDEANSAIGLARAAVRDPALDEVLAFLQQRLMNCSAILAAPAPAEDTPVISDGDIGALESAVDRLMERAGPLGGFVLPAGDESAARLHVARTVLRRGERRVVELDALQPVDPQVLRFLNRGSDVLFAAARYATAVSGSAEESWDRTSPAP